QRRSHQPGQRRRLAHPLPKLGNAVDVVVLLVAIKRGAVVADLAVEDRGDAGQALEVGRDIPAHLQLVVAAAIAARHLLERLREPIADPLGGGLVAGHDRVEQANGVPHGDLTPRTEPGEKAGKLETVEIGGELGDGKARQIAADHVGKRLAADAPERIENGAIEERGTIARHQWQQSKLCSALELLGVAAAVETERRAPAPVTVEPY